MTMGYDHLAGETNDAATSDTTSDTTSQGRPTNVTKKTKTTKQAKRGKQKDAATKVSDRTLYDELPFAKELEQLTQADWLNLTLAQRTLYEDRAAWRRVAQFLARCRERATQPNLKDVSRLIYEQQGYRIAFNTISEYQNPDLLPDSAPRRLFALLRHYGVSLTDLERVMNDTPLPQRTIHSEVEPGLIAIFRRLSPANAAILAAEAGVLAHREGIPLPAPVARLLPPRPAVAYLPGTVGIADDEGSDGMPDETDDLDEEAQLRQANEAFAAESDAIVQEVEAERRAQRRHTTDGSAS
jgi:hypothetical protein